MWSGTLTGEGVNARLAMPGGDWMTVSTDHFGRPDVRVQFETDDGALILLHYAGLVERSDAFLAAAESDQGTDWDDQYMRFAMPQLALAWDRCDVLPCSRCL